MQREEEEEVAQSSPRLMPSSWGYFGSICRIGGLISIGGLVLGSFLRGKHHNPPPWDYVSAAIGWGYFLAWGISFLPQIHSNYVRRSIAGQSTEFVFLNTLGFAAYSVYAVLFYCSDVIRESYRERFGNDNSVALNDVIFALWALFWCSVNVWQVFAYGDVKYHCNCTATAAFALLLFTAWAFALRLGFGGTFSYLDLLYATSMIKLSVTVVKYIPQIVMNYRRQMTIGWSMGNVMLDFAGGVLSIAQMVIDSVSTSDWSSTFGNPIKLLLGGISIFYDGIFFVQHFILYSENNTRKCSLISIQ